MNNNEIFDMKLENKPQKEMNAKTKKILIYSLCAVIGIIVAAAAIFLFDYIFAGAATPQEAVANYQKASFTYDIDGMVEYSSYYNKIVLYGNNETSDRLLKAYLKKGYEGYESSYKEENMSFKLVSSLEYERGEGRYDEFMERYCQKVENGRDEVDSVALVKMTIDNGKSVTTREYIAVKCGFRWFFAFGVGV